MAKIESYQADVTRAQKAKTRKIVFLVLAGVLTVVSLFVGIRYLINRRFVKDYTAKNYETEANDPLLKLNFPSSYVALYNEALLAYQHADYERAEDYFNRALKARPRHKEDDDCECDVRVNLCLSMLEQINYDDLDNEQGRDKAVGQLMDARKVLIENGCANDKDADGHNAEAEQLKKEIEDLLNQLTQDPPPQDENQGGDGESDSQNSGGGQDSSDSREQQIKDKLDKENRQGYQNGRESYGGYEEGGSGGYYSGEPYW